MSSTVATPALRPLSMGELLDRAIQMVRTHLGVFAGIALLPEVFGLAHSLTQVYRKSLVRVAVVHSGLGAAGLVFLLETILLVVSLMAGALEIAALCWATSRILHGEELSVRSAYASLRGRVWRMIGVGTREMFLSMWPMIPAAFLLAIVMVGAGLAAPVVYIIIVVLLLAPCAALYPRYALGFPVAAVEGCTGRVSIQRSVDLGRDYRWKVFGAVALPALMMFILFISAAVLFNWLETKNAAKGTSALIWEILEQVSISATRLVAAPFSACALTLAYFDLRVRKEALDVESMMAAAGMPLDEPAAASAAPQPPPAGENAWAQTPDRESAPYTAMPLGMVLAESAATPDGGSVAHPDEAADPTTPHAGGPA